MPSIWAIRFKHGQSCTVDELKYYPSQLIVPEVEEYVHVHEKGVLLTTSGHILLPNAVIHLSFSALYTLDCGSSGTTETVQVDYATSMARSFLGSGRFSGVHVPTPIRDLKSELGPALCDKKCPFPRRVWARD